MPNSLLIVEDDPDQLDVMTQWFTRSGYSVSGYSHPRKALNASRTRQFQVAILDLTLPEMDGIELMQLLNDAQPDIQVVILSGRDYSLEQARSEGAFTCVEKPCSLAKLETIVEEAFELSVTMPTARYSQLEYSIGAPE